MTFAPGETQKVIQISAFGDNIEEPGSLWGAEWGGIVVGSPTNAVFGAGYLVPVGFALIVDDD